MAQPLAPPSDLTYRLLLEISTQISRTIDLQEVVSHLLASVQSVVDYDAAGIFVLNREAPADPAGAADLIAAMASVGFPSGRRNDPMLRSGKGIVGHVIRTGESVIAADVRLDDRYVEGRTGTRSEVAVPIVSNGEVIGALNLESNRLGAFTDNDAALLEAFAVTAAISIEKAMLHQQVLEKHRLEQQLRIARDVQVSLLPAGAPRIAGYDIAGLNLPTWEIGGDYFDYLLLGADRLGLVMADVCGKGVPAALLMATFRATLRAEARRDQDVAAVVEEVHRTIAESIDTSRFVTAVYGELNTRTGVFSYVNCGHNPPMVLRASGAIERLPTGRRAVGMFGSVAAPVARVTLEEGDTLVLFTDGVVELNDGALAEFGDARLARVLASSGECSAEDTIGALVEATRAHAGREHYDDDFTLMVVKRRAGHAV